MSGTKASEPNGRPSGGRRLIAVLHTDMVGYSRLIGLDDVGTLERLRTLRRTLIDPAIAEHGGRIVNTGGDSLLIVFDSVDGAVRCAIKVQQQVPVFDGDQPPDRTIRFRTGINVGDVIPDGSDVHGDVVNVTARLQAECPPGGICVSRAVRDHVQYRLDLTFEELGTLNLKNISRPVEAFLLKLDGPKSAERSLINNTPEALPLPDKPSIAVLPFENMSGDPEQEYFVDGMVEEITTALSRIRWLFVVARTSTFTYKNQASNVGRIGRELGVRYVLEGSVRKGGGRVRITAQLIEAETGTHLWSDRFDGTLEDVFELQEMVAVSVAGVIEPTLKTAETARSASRPTSDLTAYDAYLRANAMLTNSGERIPQALALLEEAIGRDPNYGPALALAAICCFRLCADGSSKNSVMDRREGLDFGHRALRMARDDPAALANAAFALGWFGEDIGSMIAVIDRALRLNPSHARGWYISGTLRLFAGEPEIAIEHLETALRLSPRARLGTVNLHIGIALLVSRRFDEALAKFLLDIQDVEPNNPGPYRYLAACYAHLGRLDDARQVIERLRAITPLVIEDLSYLRNSEHRELVLSGLRIAAGAAT